MNEKEAFNINLYSNKSSSSNLQVNNNKIDKSLLEEQLKCPICNLLYDSEIHSPFVIKCGHTFCKQCIINNQNNNCPIDNTINPFDLYIKNIQLEIIINKCLYIYNNKTTPIHQKKMIYVKPDIKRNKNSNYEKEEENNNNININNNNLNNEIPNKIRGKSNNQRFRNSDYKMYENNFQNSPIYNRNSKKNCKINIIPKNINNENVLIYTKKDNIMNMNQFNNKNNIEENKIIIKNNEKNDEFKKDNINNEENFKFEDEKISDMLINESIETIPINEEKSFTNLSIREEFNDLLTKNEIYKKRIVINNNNNLNKNEENKNINNNNINFKSPCKKIIVKENINNNNPNENFFNESNKKIILDEMAFTIPKQFMKLSNYNIGLNSEKEIYPNEVRQLTESNNNTEKKMKENKTFQNFFNSTTSNKTNSNTNTNSNNNNTNNNKNVKTVFDYIQSISNKPSIANNNINIIDKNKNNEDSLKKNNLFPNYNQKNNNNINNNNYLNNKILKNNGSHGEMRSCKKYIKVRASSKISKKKCNIIQNNTNNSDFDEENNSKKNNQKNKKMNQIKVIPKRDINDNTINKNNDSNKCVNLSTLYNKKKIKSQQNNSESMNNSGLSLEKYINGGYGITNKQSPIEIKRKEINSLSNQKNGMFNNNINNINIMISPDKNNNILLKENGSKQNFINNEIISKTINLSPINPFKDLKNNLGKNNDKNENNENNANNINSIANLNFITSDDTYNKNIIEQNIQKNNNSNNNNNKKKELIKTRSQSTSKNKFISVNSKIYASQINLNNNNINKQDKINNNNISITKTPLLSKNEIINKLKKEYETLPLNDKLIENKKKYDEFFNKAIENPMLLDLISNNKNNNCDLFSIKFIENDDIFIGEFESNLITPKKGILLTVNGEYYEGEFLNGKKDGKGKLIYKNGTEYIGDFKNNRHNGYGQLTQMDGEIFQGEWKEGKINGNGTRFHSNGDKYIGNYINNIRNGHMKEIGKMEKLMDKVFLNIIMEMYMKENLKII